MRVTRRRSVFGGALLAVCVVLARRVRAQAEFRYKPSNTVSQDHPFNIRARAAEPRTLEETRSRLDLQIFANNQLRSDTDVLSQTRSHPFREVLRRAGFYTSRQQRFGDESWSLLEGYSGMLT